MSFDGGSCLRMDVANVSTAAAILWSAVASGIDSLQRGTRWDESHSYQLYEKYAMHKQATEEILAVLQKHQVPLQHGVALLCKTRGEQLGALSRRCGFHRNSLYKALAGELPPNPTLVAAVSAELGVNPWDFAARCTAGASGGSASCHP